MPGIRLGSHIPRTVLDVQRRICGGLPLLGHRSTALVSHVKRRFPLLVAVRCRFMVRDSGIRVLVALLLASS